MKPLKTIGIITLVMWVTLVTYSMLQSFLSTGQGRSVLVSIATASVFISGITLLVNYLVNKKNAGAT